MMLDLIRKTRTVRRFQGEKAIAEETLLEPSLAGNVKNNLVKKCSVLTCKYNSHRRGCAGGGGQIYTPSISGGVMEGLRCFDTGVEKSLLHQS